MLHGDRLMVCGQADHGGQPAGKDSLKVACSGMLSAKQENNLTITCLYGFF
jgi:hypothetical protein